MTDVVPGIDVQLVRVPGSKKNKPEGLKPFRFVFYSLSLAGTAASLKKNVIA